MYKAVFRCGVAIFATLGTAKAAAAPIDYGCNSPAGAYSEIEQAQPGAKHFISGAIEAIIFRSHNKYLPTATVMLQSRERQLIFGVRLMQQRRSGKLIDASIFTSVNGEIKLWNVATIGLDNAVPFSIETEETGPAVVTLAGQRMEIPLKLGSDSRLRITCSTGLFNFNDLDWTEPPGAP